MAYTIKICPDRSDPDVQDYFKVRAAVYRSKLGQDLYDDYPTPHDKKDGAVFLTFKACDTVAGTEVVFGGRRLVPSGNGPLPFEGKHKIKNREAANRYATLRGKDKLDVCDVIPAIRHGEDIICMEAGGFAIDQDVTRRLFTKPQYVEMREAIYAATLKAAKEAGADIVIIGPHQNNLKHQKEWLEKSSLYEFRHLGKTRDIFTNPLPEGQESELLVINVSGRYKLAGPESILRFNQEAAQSNRKAGRSIR